MNRFEIESFIFSSMAGIVGTIKFESENKPCRGRGHLYLIYNVKNRGQASAKVITQMKDPAPEIYFYNNGVKYIILTNGDDDKLLYCEYKNNGGVRELFNHKILTDLYGDLAIGGVSNRNLDTTASLPYRYKTSTLQRWLYYQPQGNQGLSGEEGYPIQTGIE